VGFSATREYVDAEGYLVAVDGALDAGAALRLETLLLELIDCGARRIAVDLSATTGIGPSAVRVLIVADRSLRRAGGRLRVVQVGSVLEGVEASPLGHLLSAGAANGTGDGAA
jgi:anti-anti-sigma regulatory factor